MSATQCYNISQYRRSKKEKLEKIRQIVLNHPEGVLPKIVAIEARLSYSTTRGYLRLLVDSCELYKQPGTSLYKVVANSTYSATADVPKIQNVRLNVKCPGSIRHNEITETIGSIKISVTFGQTHQRITGFIAAEPPMGLREFQLAVFTFKRIAKDTVLLDIDDDMVLVTSCELNNDLVGLRLDGVEAVTLRAFTGDMEKLYNKADSVRREVRVRNISLPELYNILTGGIKNYMIIQAITDLKEEVKTLEKAVKHLVYSRAYPISNTNRRCS